MANFPWHTVEVPGYPCVIHPSDWTKAGPQNGNLLLHRGTASCGDTGIGVERPVSKCFGERVGVTPWDLLGFKDQLERMSRSQMVSDVHSHIHRTS